MPKNLSKLPPGKHADGNNLYLNVTPGGARHWSFRVMRHGDAHEFGLGTLADVSLAAARRRAAELRVRLVTEGAMPVPRRVTAKPVAGDTFRTAMEAFLRDRSHRWRSAKYASDWRFTIQAYAMPVIGDKAPGAITKSDILQILRPMWQDKASTASRLRGRIEQILEHFHAHSGDTDTYTNPASWRGLQHILGTKGNGATNFTALPWQRVPELMRWLEGRSGVNACALRFLILTAARTNEVRGATWSEIDTKLKLWVIPGNRMKANTEHVVPLSDQALAVLEGARSLDTLVFPQLGKNAMLDVLQEFEPTATTHGLRSGFRDWCAERGVARELAEMSLAHQVGSAVERAYLRSRLLEPRRQLMAEWAAFVCA